MKLALPVFKYTFIFSIFVCVFLFVAGNWQGNVEAATGAGTKGGTTISATSLPVWIASAGETFNITVRLSDFSTGGSTTVTATSIGGASFTPGSTNTTVTAAGTRDVVFSVTAPNEGVNVCPVGKNDFEVRFSSPEYGWATQTIQLYASVGLTVNNSRTTAVSATVSYTSWGGLTGQTFNVGAGGANGPANRWAVNCGTYPNVTIGVTVGGVVYYGTSSTVNGCSFQVNITIPTISATPAPTPSPSPPPGVTPPSNLSATPGCFGAVPVVTFNWSLGTSSSIFLDVSDNNWSSFHNRDMGSTTSLSWNPWDPMADGFAPSVSRTYQWRLWDGTSHTFGPNVTTGSCGGVVASPTPTPIGGGCPVGCPGASNTVTWSRPTGNVAFSDSGGVTSSCSSTGTSCTSGAVFWPGSPVIYNVRLSSSGGIIIKTGGVNAGADTRASASWDWDYDVVWCEVPGASDTSCYANPTAQTVAVDNNTAASPSKLLSGLKPTQYYAYQIVVKGTSSNTELTNGNFRSGGCGCPSPTPVPSPTPPGVPQIPTGSAPSVPTCVTAGQTYGPTMTLNWSASSGATSYTVRLTSPVKTGGDYATKTVGSTSATGTGSWSTGGNPLVTWVSGGNLALQPNVTYFFAVKAVGPGGDSGYDLNGKSTQIGPVALCGPAPPSNLVATTSCDPSTGNAEIAFTFRDNSVNEELFWVDVNQSAWTGPGAPSPWGFKTLNANAGSGGTVIWVWTVADPLSSGPPTIPVENRTYYWRVRAHNSQGDSAHIYPANSTIPPGVAIATPVCADPESDLSASIVPASWRNSRAIYTQTFDIGERVTLTVNVKNNSLAPSPVTKLYFFFNGTGLPTCPSPPGTAVTTPPLDGVGFSQTYDVPIVAAGANIDIPVAFNVSTTPTTTTGYAYVVPACTFAPATITDPNYVNNLSGGFTYDVAVNKFFETKGGDVAAIGNIRVGFKSKDIALPVGPKYQSDYVLGAFDIDDNSSSKSNMTLKNYQKPYVAGGGVFNSFYTRLKDKWTNGCNLVAGINYCSAATKVISGTDSLPSGDMVMIVEGDLEIKKNLALPDINSTATFIVKGDIKLDLGVARIDGVYIARKGFSDSNVADAGVIPGGALNVNGALYADCEEDGVVSLGRYFISPLNNLRASDVFNFDPKYIVKLQNIIGVNPIVWREVDP